MRAHRYAPKTACDRTAAGCALLFKGYNLLHKEKPCGCHKNVFVARAPALRRPHRRWSHGNRAIGRNKVFRISLNILPNLNLINSSMLPNLQVSINLSRDTEPTASNWKVLMISVWSDKWSAKKVHHLFAWNPIFVETFDIFSSLDNVIKLLSPGGRVHACVALPESFRILWHACLLWKFISQPQPLFPFS